MNANTNTARKPGRPKNTGGKAPALTLAQVKTLLRVTAAGPQGTRNTALVTMLLNGLRVSEPLSLRRSDVLDPKGRVLNTFVLGATNTKSKKHRRCYLNETAHKALRAWMNEMENQKPDALIFNLNTNYATQLVAKLLREAGIKASSHSLRRTCATTLAANAVSPRVIQELLGHANLGTTMVYLETSPALVERAINNNLEW